MIWNAFLYKISASVGRKSQFRAGVIYDLSFKAETNIAIFVSALRCMLWTHPSNGSITNWQNVLFLFYFYIMGKIIWLYFPYCPCNFVGPRNAYLRRFWKLSKWESKIAYYAASTEEGRLTLKPSSPASSNPISWIKLKIIKETEINVVISEKHKRLFHSNKMHAF